MELLKKLRAMTQAPLTECKNALEEAGGDLDQAQQILRDRGALKASKKADRETNEWVVVMQNVNNMTVGIKFACETDFVAKNETFRGLAQTIVGYIAEEGKEIISVDELSDTTKERVDALIKDNFVTIGENMQLLDAFAKEWQSYIYAHPGDKIAVAVFYQGEEEAAKDAALQIAAMNPWFHKISDVPSEQVEEEKARFMEELAEDSKPEDIKAKIVEGKLAKFYSEIVFEEQSSIKDDSKKMKEYLAGRCDVDTYIRYAI